MINLLLGSSGGGKSYEAVVHHILPAMEQGRKVVTNLPLNVETIYSLDPSYRGLIEIRNKPQSEKGLWTPTEDNAFQLYNDEKFYKKPDLRQRVFSKVWDYYDDWKHAETGVGALFVIDECQYSIPRGRTDVQVEEYTALHRHYRVDILYITQSYGKISKAIVDNLQMVYRCRKQTALGRQTHYIRKVQDGVRGEVMNVSSREYNKAYFQFYNSHTQTSSGSEQGASDVTPIWKHWSFKGAAVCFILFVIMLTNQFTKEKKQPALIKKDPFQAENNILKKPPLSKTILVGTPEQFHYEPGLDEPEEIEVRVNHPFSGYGIHIVGSGYYRYPGKRVFFYNLKLSQNGIVVNRMSDTDLTKVGYLVEAYSKCSMKIVYGDHVQWITCGNPTISPIPVSS